MKSTPHWLGARATLNRNSWASYLTGWLNTRLPQSARHALLQALLSGNIPLGGRDLCPYVERTFHRDEEMLAAFALKAVLLHVVGSGLYTTEVDTSERGGSSALDLITGQHSQYHSDTMKLDGDVMAEFADGTGGTYFHNSNDLEGGFKTLAHTPEFVYLIEFPLERVKPDGAYHRLKVKVNQDGPKVQARRGYFAPAPPKTKSKVGDRRSHFPSRSG